MTGRGGSGQGTGGSGFDGQSQRYDGVPFSSLDFPQPYCDIQDYGNPEEVRNCYLVSLNDLDGSLIFICTLFRYVYYKLLGGKQYVREKVSAYFNGNLDEFYN